ncbi:hypothetical protein [Pseudomonas maumuensis]|uniref:Uncharacterized protein n=1 Tax=Pseudomonas maumuensis TaxID=2842354 RepID=A0ABX8NRN0_9PSED|nr:hypothetical protein [Pseudomonas maumuensis]QXH58659.1 hypothetical protein KSS90_10790 [Pseudomonas maumuensis]
MFEMTRHHLRQVRYRWLSWRADPLYLLFERMYRCDPGALPTVTPHPSQRGFLLTQFICADFVQYRGREIAFFNPRQVAVYWLPGAAHSGGGHVADGDYEVTVAGHAVRRPVRLQVRKEAQHTSIRAVASGARHADRVQGGFIAFAIIARELRCLTLQWLEQLPRRLAQGTVGQDWRQVLEQATQLVGERAVQRQAERLLHDGAAP